MRVEACRILETSSHVTELRNLICKAVDRVDIVSPWILGSAIHRVLEFKPENVKLVVTFRWPTDKDDASLYDFDLIERLACEENTCFRWLGTSTPLHAKVYLIEGVGAILTSANMTNKGFPFGGSKNSNTELGFITHDPNCLNSIAEIIESWDSHVLISADLEALQRWKQKQAMWKQQNRDALAAKTSPPVAPERVDNPVVQALGNAVKNDTIRGFKHETRGMGRKAYSLNLSKNRSSYPVRALISISGKNLPAGIEDNYHFEVSRQDVVRWKQKEYQRINGVVLIPVVDKNGIPEFVPDRTPVAFLPFSELFRRGRFSITAFTRPKGRKPPVLFLSRRSTGLWVIRIPSAKVKEINAKPFLNSASKMKNSRINWQK